MADVYIAEDHPLYRRAISHVVEAADGLDLVGCASDGRRALDEIVALDPGVAVIDLQMPGLDGLKLLEALDRVGSRARVLVLSAHAEPAFVHRALEAGAIGFLTKDEDGETIASAIRAAARGETVLGGRIQAAVAASARTRRRAPRVAAALSAREVDVLRLTAEGLSSIEVGRSLHLSPATVKSHLQRIYGKLGVSDRAAAVAEAMRLGVIA